jgi:hypothetical protein
MSAVGWRLKMLKITWTSACGRWRVLRVLKSSPHCRPVTSSPEGPVWSKQIEKLYDDSQSFADLEWHVHVINVHQNVDRPGDTIPAQNLLNAAPVYNPLDEANKKFPPET